MKTQSQLAKQILGRVAWSTPCCVRGVNVGEESLRHASASDSCTMLGIRVVVWPCSILRETWACRHGSGPFLAWYYECTRTVLYISFLLACTCPWNVRVRWQSSFIFRLRVYHGWSTYPAGLGLGLVLLMTMPYVSVLGGSSRRGVLFKTGCGRLVVGVSALESDTGFRWVRVVGGGGRRGKARRCGGRNWCAGIYLIL